MSEAHTTSERAGKLNLDGDRRMARRRLGAWVRKLLAAAPELAPALRPLPAVEADGPATATTGARAAREAADAADAALCRKLMDVLTLSADGDAEAILFSATTGREAFAALLEAVDADPTTPDGAEALVEDITRLSWNRHAGSMDFAIAAGDILFRLAHAAGMDYAAFALMRYGTGNVRYDDLVRRLVKAVDQDNAPDRFAHLHATLSVRLHEAGTTLSYKVAIDAITAHARSVGLARPTGPMGPTMTVTQAEQSSLGLGQREATLMTPRRAAPAAFRPTWCLICCARGHDEADCTADIPKGEEPCFFCRKIGHDIKKCPSKDANGFETWNPNAPGDENAMPTPFPRANSGARARWNAKKKQEHFRAFRRHERPADRRGLVDMRGGDVRPRPRDARRDPHQTDARGSAVLPIAPARRDPLRQHGRARAHQAAPRQLAPPPLPRQHRLRVPRHRARPDDRALLQDRAYARGLPHEGLTRRRVPRERRPRLPGVRVRPALNRPDGTIPLPSPDQSWPPDARDTSADARGNLGLPCTTTSPETSPRRTRASSTFRLAGSCWPRR